MIDLNTVDPLVLGLEAFLLLATLLIKFALDGKTSAVKELRKTYSITFEKYRETVGVYRRLDMYFGILGYGGFTFVATCVYAGTSVWWGVALALVIAEVYRWRTRKQ